MSGPHQALLMSASSTGVVGFTWNPSDKNASVTLSNGNLTATAASTNQAVRGTVGKSSGKWYFEVTFNGSVIFGTVGIATAAASLSEFVGGDAEGYGTADGHSYHVASDNLHATSIAAGDVIGVALDLDAGKIWFSKNGSFAAFAGDPATGVGAGYTGISGTFYPADSPGAVSHTINSTLSFAPPSGFSPWA